MNVCNRVLHHYRFVVGVDHPYLANYLPLFTLNDAELFILKSANPVDTFGTLSGVVVVVELETLDHPHPQHASYQSRDENDGAQQSPVLTDMCKQNDQEHRDD